MANSLQLMAFLSLNLRIMYINCTDKELFIFKKIAKTAGAVGVPCYLIGGFVRDKILGRDTRDIDIVCVGDGIALAHKVAQQFDPAPEVNFFKKFGDVLARQLENFFKKTLNKIFPATKSSAA